MQRNKLFIALSLLTSLLLYNQVCATVCDITAGFTYAKTTCSNNVSFTDQSTTVTGTIIKREWNFGDSSPLSTTTNPVHTYAAPGDFTVTLTVTNNLGYSSSKAQVIHISAPPFAAFSVSTPDCTSRDITFDPANSLPGDGAFSTFKWDFGDGITQIKTSKQPFTHQYVNAGSHTTTLTITSTTGCVSNMATKTITVYQIPLVEIAPIPTICQGAQPVQFTVDTHGFAGAGSFSGTGVSPTGLFDPAATGPGKFDITYTYTTPAGCTYTAATIIEVDPLPRVTGTDVQLLEGGRAKIIIPEPTGVQPLKYKWTLANGDPATGLDRDNIVNPTVTATESTSYMLTVTSGEGCSASAIVNVNILKKLLVPNAFTPNGDGINDTWVIHYLDTYAGCTVTVFNRYGFKIYQSTGYSKPWDGRGGNGEPVEVGTYYYIIDPKNGDKAISGNLTVLR